MNPRRTPLTSAARGRMVRTFMCQYSNSPDSVEKPGRKAGRAY